MAEGTSDRTDAVTGYLESRSIDYELVEHEERFTAAAEARAAGAEPADAAKDVLLRRDEEYVLAVIPASERLDIHKVRDLIGEVRLATEDEISGDFSRFEVGALPPFGSLLGVSQIVDRRLLDHERVLCSSGDHRHSLRVDPRDMVSLSEAQLADLCED